MLKRSKAALALLVLIGVSATAAAAPQSLEPIQNGFGKGAYPAHLVTPGVTTVIDPEYTKAALEARVEGDVRLEAVVGSNGSVREVRVVKSLDAVHGLDAAAIAAAKKWKFRPGSIGSKKVSTVVSIQVSFRLHPPGDPTGGPFTEGGVLAPSAPNPLPNAVPLDTPGLVQPRVRSSVDPQYSSEAMRQKIQGEVHVQAVIQADGRVGEVRVIKSLDATFGLDEQALKAAKSWFFTPARLNGQAVPVRVTLVIAFRLH